MPKEKVKINKMKTIIFFILFESERLHMSPKEFADDWTKDMIADKEIKMSELKTEKDKKVSLLSATSWIASFSFSLFGILWVFIQQLEGSQ